MHESEVVALMRRVSYIFKKENHNAKYFLDDRARD